MIAIWAVAPLIIVLWLVAWISGSCGATLPKKDWKRLPLALLALGTYLGIPALQVYFLTALGSNAFAHGVFFYMLVPEYVVAIFLTFVALIRGNRAKKR